MKSGGRTKRDYKIFIPTYLHLEIFKTKFLGRGKVQ